MKVERNEINNTNFGKLYIKGCRNILGIRNKRCMKFLEMVKPELEAQAVDTDIYVKFRRPFGTGFDIGADKVVNSPIKRFFRFLFRDTVFSKLKFENGEFDDTEAAKVLIEKVQEINKDYTDYRAYYSQ